MTEKSISSSTDVMDDGCGLLKLELEESDLPEIGIDVTKLEIGEGEVTKNVREAQKATKSAGQTDKNGSSIADEKQAEENSKVSTTTKETGSKSKHNLNFIWVSNLRKGVKATDIKKFFSQIGKVTAVKILSNGKNFYGYLAMETKELAAKCISDLNEALFQGDKIIVSKKRPDLNEMKQKFKIKEDASKKADNENKENKENDEKKEVIKDLPKENLNAALTETKTNVDKHREKSVETKSKSVESKVKIIDNSRQEMLNKIDSLSYSNRKLKQRLDQIQILYNGICRKYRNLKEDFSKAKFENRQEMRKLDQEKEDFEKTKKAQLAKIESEKEVLKKVLADVRKLKESLKRKVDAARIESRKPLKRERSPLSRSVSPRRRYPLPQPKKRFYRDEPREDKKFRHSPRGKTPPPPNYSPDIVKKRNETNISSSRPLYYSQSHPSQSNPIDYRLNRSFPSYDGRPNWIEPPRDLRRTTEHGQGRFPSVPMVQHPNSIVVPRTPNDSYYYPQW